MKAKLESKCPMFDDMCRHCSLETTTRAFTVLGKDPKTQLFMPVKQSKVVVDLGAFCNNIGAWVEDMHYCPSRWALYRGKDKPTVKPVVKKKKPSVSFKICKAKKKPATKKKVRKTMDKNKKDQKWKLRKDGPTKRSAEILHIGQQKLFIEQR
jgi:hypothetical protein